MSEISRQQIVAYVSVLISGGSSEEGEVGELYARLPHIDLQIDDSVKLRWDDLKARLAISDRKNDEYLASETLVHLIRKSRREGNKPVLDAVVTALFVRCEASLLRMVRESLPNASHIREEVMGEFAKLLARDGTGNLPDRLDPFEWRFNLVFKSLRLDAIRRETRAVNRNISFSDDVTAVDIADMEAVFDKVANLQTSSDSCSIYAPSPEDQMMAQDIYKQLNTLPKDERNALIETKIFGLTEEAAGRKLGVSARTIGTRKRNAIARLRSLEEST